MAKLPWLKLRKKTAPELPYEPPIFLGNKSNGEFFHSQTPAERKIRDEILRQCDDKARKLGIDRREFIASAMGMCTSLAVLNLAAGCGDKRGHMPMSMADSMLNPTGSGGAGGMSSSGGTGGMSGSGGSTPVAMGPVAGNPSKPNSGSGGSRGNDSKDGGASMMAPDGQCADWCS